MSLNSLAVIASLLLVNAAKLDFQEPAVALDLDATAVWSAARSATDLADVRIADDLAPGAQEEVSRLYAPVAAC